MKQWAYLVWTLPIQKLILLCGLSLLHHHIPRLTDLFSILPETVFALFITALYLRQQKRWFAILLGCVMAAFSFASWFVVVPWMVSGRPLPYALIKQFATGSATLRTIVSSFTLLTQILAWIGTFFFLCFLILFIASSMRKKLIPETWVKRTWVLISLGVLTAVLLIFSPGIRLTNRFAIIVPFYSEAKTSTLFEKVPDPFSLSVLCPPERKKIFTKPMKHVLLIVFESIRYQQGSLFDKGFQQAIHFNRAYVHHPRSVKTLEALVFGIYPSTSLLTSVWAIDNYDMEKMDPLPRVLSQYGFLSTYYAAFDLGYDNYRQALQVCGFDRIEMVEGANPLTWGVDADTLFSRVFETLKSGNRNGQSQFVMAWTSECHMPYDFVGQEDKLIDPKAQYLACQEGLAGSFDRMLKRMKRSGLLDQTLVIAMGDHGQIFSNEKEGEWGHGQHVYESSVRIPILVFCPGYQGILDDRRLFQPVDVPATILSMLNIIVPRSWVGRNMLDPSEPGRDFVVFLSTLSDGTMGVLERSGLKYVRYRKNESLVSYQIDVDPYEQAPRPLIAQEKTVIEKKLNTYLTVATQGWESKRKREQTFGHSYRGCEIATKWYNNPCIEIVPDEMREMTLFNPVMAKGCQGNSDPFSRAIAKAFPVDRFEDEVRIEFKVMITGKEEIRGRQPRSLVKIWGLDPPVIINLQPEVDVWQTVSVILPRPKQLVDQATGQTQKDITIGVVPVDLPVQFAVSHIVVEPGKVNFKHRLGNWFSRFKIKSPAGSGNGN